MLRSSDDDQPVVPTLSHRMGDRDFSFAAPQLRNRRPLEIYKTESPVIRIYIYIFWANFPILNPLCSGMLDRQIGTLNGR